MESENQSVGSESAVSEVSTPAITESPQISGESGQNSPPQPLLGSEEQPYSPNYKVKAYDNEYEIPENFRGYINKDNEKNFREVFEKFYAVDVMKEKLNKTRSENENLAKVKGDYDTLSKNLSQVSKYLQNKDYGSFFKAVQLDEGELQKWMYQQLKQAELPPEQREVFQKNQEYLQNKYDLESQNETFRQELDALKQQQQQFSIAKRDQELDSVLNRPEVSSVAQSFDARLGQQGAFKNEVIQRAAFIFQSQNRDLTAEEAVNEALKVVAWNQSSSSDQGDKVLPPQANKKPPTLPSMQGKATSPVNQKVNSLDDLKKLRSQSIRVQNN